MKIKQLNKEDMELYEKSVKEYDDILDAISFEGSKREAIGEARGIAIGETRGIAIGEARGIAIGETRGEERAKRTIVKSLLSKGFTLKDIEQLTGIPLDDLISICHK